MLTETGSIKMSASNTQPQASPLLNLPPEIRNTIYSYALVDPGPVRIYCSDRLPEHLENSPDPFCWQPPALLQTSRQILAEASAMYYANNRFKAVSNDEIWGDVLKRWLDALGQENVRSLSFVGVEVFRLNAMVIDLVHELFDFWKGLQRTNLALEKEVLKMFLPVVKARLGATDDESNSYEELEWLSVARLEGGRVAVDVVWEDGSHELGISWKMLKGSFERGGAWI